MSRGEKNSKSFWNTWYAKTLAVAFMLGAIVYLAEGIGIIPHYGSATIGGSQPGPSQNVFQNALNGPFCNTASSVTIRGFAFNNSVSGGIPVQLSNSGTYSGNYEIYQYGSGTRLASGGLSSTAVQPSTAQTFPCNHVAFGTVGDNKGTYLNVTPYYAINGTTPTQILTGYTQIISVPSFNFNNQTSLGNTGGQISLHKGGATGSGYGNNQQVSELQINENGGTGNWGEPTTGGFQAWGVLFNTSQAQQGSFQFSFNGAPCSSFTGTPATVSNAVVGNPLTLWFSCPTLGPNQNAQLKVQWYTATMNANSAYSANVYIFSQPAMNLIKFNGSTAYMSYGLLWNSTSATATYTPLQVVNARVWK